MYRVTREVKFCFGHRLEGYPGKCRHLHGHNARAFFTVDADRLDKLGMSVDFAHIKKTLKSWIDANLDHKTILKKNDPLLAAFKKAGEPAYSLDDNPTTENLARHLFEQAARAGIPVTQVALWENDASCATYSPAGSRTDQFAPDDDEERSGSSAGAMQQNAGPREAALAAPSTGGPFFVTREMKFCFGHRIMNYPGQCRQIHGHNGRLTTTVAKDRLDELGMAADFGVLKRGVQNWIDSEWDHAMILHKGDPMIPVLRDFGSPSVEMDVPPTTENLARAVYERSAAAGLAPAAIHLWETDACGAGYAPAPAGAV